MMWENMQITPVYNARGIGMPYDGIREIEVASELVLSDRN